MAYTKDQKQLIIFIGPPGCGKGTQAPLLSNYLKIPHISTGDLFRCHMNQQTPIGKEVQIFIDHGQLVPDEIVLKMVFDRISQEDCKNGAILDGFPRTQMQAEALAYFTESTHLLRVIEFSIDPQLLVQRIAKRLCCKDCGKSCKRCSSDQKTCSSCQGVLYQRTDDTEETFSKRLDAYRSLTEPLISYYRTKNMLQKIAAHLSKEEVFQQIIDLLNLETMSMR